MGCDGLGISVAAALTEQGHTVHILDPRAEAFGRLPPGEVEQGRIVPIVGDGTLQQDLERAYIKDAHVFMALTDIDTRNVLAAQMARHLYQVPKVICRIDDPTTQKMYNDLGIVALSSMTLVSQSAVRAASA